MWSLDGARGAAAHFGKRSGPIPKYRLSEPSWPTPFHTRFFCCGTQHVILSFCVAYHTGGVTFVVREVDTEGAVDRTASKSHILCRDMDTLGPSGPHGRKTHRVWVLKCQTGASLFGVTYWSVQRLDLKVPRTAQLRSRTAHSLPTDRQVWAIGAA